MLLRHEHEWERLNDQGGARWPEGTIEDVAHDVLSGAMEQRAPGMGVECRGSVCFAMIAGDRPIGVVGIATGETTASDLALRRKAGAAAALLAVAVDNVRLFAEVQEHSVRDALTGCFNRAHTSDALDTEIGRSRRSGTPLSVLMFDVDHFKRVNDTYGHLSGDAVLSAVGQRLRHVLRKSDIRCRFGGDEFMVVLPDTPESGALRVAEWLRSEMEQIKIDANPPIRVSISVGITTAFGGDTSAAALIERADRALYEAKAAGRNCVRSAQISSRHTAPLALAAGGAFVAH